jgi:hypothetical protein
MKTWNGFSISYNFCHFKNFNLGVIPALSMLCSRASHDARNVKVEYKQPRS